MRVETLRDILHWTSKFHHHLNQRLHQSTDDNKSERARLLLDYLSEHEKRLSHVIHRFEEEGDEDALNTWCYEYLDKNPIVQHRFCDAPFEQLTAREIMAVVVEQHEQIIELYRYLRARADIPSAEALLDNLKALEEREIMQMVQSANRLDEL